MGAAHTGPAPAAERWRNGYPMPPDGHDQVECAYQVG